MSHFPALVILPTDTIDIEAAVSHALAPYSKSLEVNRYFVECICKNRIAAGDAFDYTENHSPKKIDQYRKEFWNRPLEVLQKIDWEQLETDWERFSKCWQRIYRQAEQSHPLYQQFDPKCEICMGTGRCKTQYNPRSKWDWWQIGGRWTGALDDYDPTQDIENQ